MKVELAEFFTNNPGILDDENDLKATFADYYKGNEIKSRIMMIAYESGILSALKDNKTSDYDRNNQINTLVDQWGMQKEKAEEAIDEWYRICPAAVVDAYVAYLGEKGIKNKTGHKNVIQKKNKWKKKVPSVLLKMIAAGCAFYMIIGVVFLFMRDTSVSEIEEALVNADYSFVVSTYNESVNGNDKKEKQINAQIETEIENIENKYLEQQSSFDEAEKNLEIFTGIKNEELSKKAGEAKTRINLNESSAVALSEGIREYEEKNYRGAMESLTKVRKESTSYDDARGKTGECADALVQSVLSGRNAEEFSEVLKIIDSALKVYPDDPDIKKCRDDLRSEYDNVIKDDAIAAAEDSMKNGEFKAALETIKQALKVLKDNPDLLGKKTDYENIIREKYLDKANACAESGDYAGALTEIKNGLGILTNDKVLLSKRKEYEPVSIRELECISEDPVFTKRKTDNYGNSYENAMINDIGYTGSSGPVRHEYLVDSKYSHLEGIIYIPEGEKSSGFSSVVIKGDGFILYSSPLMNKISQPVAFSVDIRGFNRLVFEWSNNSTYNNTSALNCCLGNVHLYYSGENQDNSRDYSTLPIALTDLQSIYSEVFYNKRLTDNFGNTYNFAIYNRRDGLHSNNIPIFEYLLNSKYGRFECTLYIPSESTFQKDVEMIVTADGKEIYRSPRMNASSKPVDVKIDLSGCNDLKITFSDQSWFDERGDATLCLANPYVYLK